MLFSAFSFSCATIWTLRELYTVDILCEAGRLRNNTEMLSSVLIVCILMKRDIQCQREPLLSPQQLKASQQSPSHTLRGEEEGIMVTRLFTVLLYVMVMDLKKERERERATCEQSRGSDLLHTVRK